jgi:HSP20 family molecular chaperone IbpA
VIVKNADVNKRQIDLDLLDNNAHVRIATKKQKFKKKEELRQKAIQKPKAKKKRRR